MRVDDAIRHPRARPLRSDRTQHHEVRPNPIQQSSDFLAGDQGNATGIVDYAITAKLLAAPYLDRSQVGAIPVELHKSIDNHISLPNLPSGQSCDVPIRVRRFIARWRTRACRTCTEAKQHCVQEPTGHRCRLKATSHVRKGVECGRSAQACGMARPTQKTPPPFGSGAFCVR